MPFKVEGKARTTPGNATRPMNDYKPRTTMQVGTSAAALGALTRTHP
jgi:hypothetical protein